MVYGILQLGADTCGPNHGHWTLQVMSLVGERSDHLDSFESPFRIAKLVLVCVQQLVVVGHCVAEKLKVVVARRRWEDATKSTALMVLLFSLDELADVAGGQVLQDGGQIVVASFLLVHVPLDVVFLNHSPRVHPRLVGQWLVATLAGAIFQTELGTQKTVVLITRRRNVVANNPNHFGQLREGKEND